jgi:DNA-directed RNA polymerase specialized sigma54-like protein
MSTTIILERIRRLFASGPGEHLDSISEALMNATLKEPVRPMSDQELARAIRECRSVRVADRTAAKLSRHLEASAARDS